MKAPALSRRQPGAALALSGIQPWWWLLLHGKCIENRSWNTSYRGPIFLHASKARDEDEYLAAILFVRERFGEALANTIPAIEKLECGGIIGKAEIVAVIEPHPPSSACRLQLESGITTRLATDLDYRWHMHDRYGFVLANAEPLPFVPCKGALSLWPVPDDIVLKTLGLAP